MWEQTAKLFVRDCWKLTPPFDDEAGGPFEQSPKHQRQVGKDAVARDIRNLYHPAEELFEGITSMRGQYAFDQFNKAQDAGAMHTLSTSFNLLENKRSWFEVKPDLKIHKRFKNKRGRIMQRKGKKKPVGYIMGKNAESKINKFIKARQKRVGTAKSGWAKPVARLKVARIPKWGKFGSHGVFKKLKKESMHGYRVGNGIGYIQSTGQELRIMNRAMRSQERNLTKRIAAAIVYAAQQTKKGKK